MTAYYHKTMTHSTSDSWAHRSEGMRCKSCMWFAPKYPDGQPQYDGDRITLPPANTGRCRRHAPTMNGYPVVFVNDWCGDHRLDENQVAQGYDRMSASEMARILASQHAKPKTTADGLTNCPWEAQA